MEDFWIFNFILPLSLFNAWISFYLIWLENRKKYWGLNRPVSSRLELQVTMNSQLWGMVKVTNPFDQGPKFWTEIGAFSALYRSIILTS